MVEERERGITVNDSDAQPETMKSPRDEGWRRLYEDTNERTLNSDTTRTEAKVNITSLGLFPYFLLSSPFSVAMSGVSSSE